MQFTIDTREYEITLSNFTIVSTFYTKMCYVHVVCTQNNDVNILLTHKIVCTCKRCMKVDDAYIHVCYAVIVAIPVTGMVTVSTLLCMLNCDPVSSLFSKNGRSMSR